MTNIKQSDVLKMLKDPTSFQYFMLKLDKPGWFNFLLKKGLLSQVPRIERNKDDNTLQSPPWWPGYYLLKIADKIPEKVTPLLKSLKTNDNWGALDLCFRITLTLPLEYAKQLMPSIDKWLDSNVFDIGDKYSINLLGKFIDSGYYEPALKLFDILSKPTRKKHINTALRYDFYYYQEEVVKRYLPELMKRHPDKVLDIIEKRLDQAIKMSKSGYEDDMSLVWRPSIGDSESNHHFGDAEDIFVTIIRDTLMDYYKRNKKAAQNVIAGYLHKKYSIYKRIAIYIIDELNIVKLYPLVLGNRSLLNDFSASREYLSLLRRKYDNLNIKLKKSALDLIKSGPMKKRDANGWTERRLRKIGDKVLSDKKLAKYHAFVAKNKGSFQDDDLEDETGKVKSWVGPTSPKTIDEIKQMAPEQLVDYIKNEFKPSKEYWQPTPEGLGRILGAVIKESPAPYAAIAERFAEDVIYPAYASNLLRALHDALREKKKFEWDSVMKLCEAMLYKTDSEENKGRKDAFDFGRFLWTRGAVADLLGEAVRTDEAISDKYMPQIKKILLYIAENDENPDSQNVDFGGDYVTQAINCNRGKALEALVLYALRYARLHNNPEADKDKGPFPPGERMEQDVKEFFERRMKEELHPAVHSIFGKFFQYLYYLDQKWVKEMLKNGYLFPSGADKKETWIADWQGYVLLGRFYKDLYYLLRNNYKTAIDYAAATGKKGHDAMADRRIGEHVMIAYINGYEPLDGEDSLVKYMFDKSSQDVRNHSIWFVGASYRKETPDARTWEKLRRLWEYRVNCANYEEVVGFSQWMTWLPKVESIQSAKDLILESIKSKGESFHQHNYYEYFAANAEAYPKESLTLMFELIKFSYKQKHLYYGYQDPVKKILEAVKPKAQEYKDIINLIVNFLGEIGDYSFREYLIQ